MGNVYDNGRFSPLCGDRMKKILITFLLCFVGLVNQLSAATYQAASCSRSAVNTEVAKTTHGDTVIIPAGNCNWADTISTDKAITIMGEGSGSTKITSTFEANGRYNTEPFILYTPGTSGINTLFRVTGIQFDCANFTPGIRIQGSTNRFRIDNSRFINTRRTSVCQPQNSQCTASGVPWGCCTGSGTGTCSCSSQYPRVLGFFGTVKGVIDNNYLQGNISVNYFRYNWWRVSSNSDWDNGTDENIFVENNEFVSTDGSQVVATATGASMVVRYNTIDYRTFGGTYLYPFDTHGHQCCPYYGSFGAEMYGNQLLINDTTLSYTLAEIRGGRAKVYYNKVDDATVGNVRVRTLWSDLYYERNPSMQECDGTLYDGYKVCDYGNRTQHPERTYFWNNRYGASGSGSLLPVQTFRDAGGEAYCGTSVVEMCVPLQCRNGYEFWKSYDDSVWSESGTTSKTYTHGGGTTFNGTSGIGCGTLSNRPATCTVGVGYWATNQSCTSVPSDSYGKSVSPANQLSGALYTCTATNTWTKTYEPYIYPHPYRDDADVTPPQYVTGTATPSGEQACASNPTNVTVGFTVTDQSPSTVVCKGCNSGVDGCAGTSTYSQIAAMAGVINFSSSCSGTSCAQTATNSSACASSKLVYARCTDGTNVMTSSVAIPYTMNDTVDSNAPTITAQEVLENGTTLRLTFSEAVQAGDAETTGFTFSRTRGETPGNVTVTCTDPFSNVTTIDCQLASTVYSTDTDTTLAYTQAGDEIEDMAGNDLASIAEPIAVTNSSTQTGTASASLWNHSDTPSVTSYAWSKATAGTRWKSSASGRVTQICFYKHADMDAEKPHTGGIWNSSGTLLGSVTFTDETESGWQCKVLAEYVDIIANDYYTVGVYFPSRRVHTTSYFAQDYTNSTFTAGTENGVHTYSESLAFPTTSSGTDRSWWVDFVFESSGGVGGPWAVTVSKTGAGCTSTGSAVVEDSDTTEVVVTVKSGWAVGISGDCPAGSGILSGNTYTYTTGQITEDCTVVATCAEVQLVPWVSP
jgi:hypothetical protein